ncbi:helix-turn-helix transcriptional regulator [Pseudonocardia humida]|uniref:YafY family transcriptional regulator n=1 Tax=Pseudonocardia humida TaxID=2800819 RepID=A0ABT1A8Y1_9PSEU|nr:YafY family protein [Pseudonocardia humida]MCO1659426.1 YafY family transcriptional regulator [Pseudonocardia humida]
MRSQRLLSLLLILQTRARATAPELARELEISVRTVYRDVAALSAAGVPVYTEQGHNGGIRLLPGYRTDITGLTAAESRALVALTGRAIPDDLGLGTALSSAVHKLIAAVPASHRADAQRARQRVLVDHTGWYRSAPPTPLLGAVQEAVWADRRLRVGYRHGDGRTAEYLLDPYGLVVKAGVWYLVAAHRGVARLHRVDRIGSAVALDERAVRPDDVDLATVWTGLRDRFEAHAAVRVRLRVSADEVDLVVRMTDGRRVGDPVVVEPGADGRAGVEVAFPSGELARITLLGLGRAVEIVEPVELRDEVLDAARELVAAYGG